MSADVVVSENELVHINPNPLTTWLQDLNGAVCHALNHVAGGLALMPPPTESRIDEAVTAGGMIDALAKSCEHQMTRIIELTEKADALAARVQQLETGIAARDVALQLALNACIIRTKDFDDPEWREANMAALVQFSDEFARRMPAATKAIQDAREHESCEQKIRDLGSAIFPMMDE